MGTMSCSGWTVEFDDRVLTHLQIVIVNRLRRGDALLMSWVDSGAVGHGRSTIWINPDAPIYFKFAGSRVPAIDQAWLKRLDASAASSTGLIVTDVDGRPVLADGQGIGHTIPRTSLSPPTRGNRPDKRTAPGVLVETRTP